MTNKFNILQERTSTWRNRIKDLKVNISQLARLSNVDRSYLSRIVHGHKLPKIKFINKVEKILTELEKMKKEAEKKEEEGLD